MRSCKTCGGTLAGLLGYYTQCKRCYAQGKENERMIMESTVEVLQQQIGHLRLKLYQAEQRTTATPRLAVL
jgi:hypothetical protein